MDFSQFWAEITKIIVNCLGYVLNYNYCKADETSSSPGRGHCVVFLGKTLYSHGASLHPGV